MGEPPSPGRAKSVADFMPYSFSEMGDPVEGVVGTGQDGTLVAPVLFGGVDGDGNVQPFLVDADGTLQTAANVTPTFAAVLGAGTDANAKSVTNMANLTLTGAVNIGGALNHDGTTVGFYGTAPVAQQTGVAVTAAGIHAALVALGLITA